MTTPITTVSTRIAAFDILRGVMLLIMLVDHIELYPSFFDYFTGRGRLFVSAAEGFFFLSGLLVGIVYKRRIAKGVKFVFARMWQRAVELYILAAITTLGFALWASYINQQSIKYGLPVPTDWWFLVKETLYLQYGFGWADFLARFSILMFAAPFAFFGLMRGHWRIVISLSLIIWLLRGENFTYAWQLLFLGGMVAGYYWQEITDYFTGLRSKTQNRLVKILYMATAATFFVSYFIVYPLSFLNDKLATLPSWLKTLTERANSVSDWLWLWAEKWTLGPLRVVLFVMWFSALFLIINRYHTLINRYTRNMVDTLGRNSLWVYILHAFIVFVFKIYIPESTNRWQNFIITALALIALIGGTYGYLKLRSRAPHITVTSIYERIFRPFRRFI